MQCGISETNSLSLEGYRLIPFQRKKSGNNRYFGGSLLLIKNEIRSGIKIIDSLGGDIIWIKIQKEFFGLEKDIYVCFVYAAPLDSCYTKKLEYDILDKVEEYILKFNKEGDVLLAGDLNAKTNIENDFVSDMQDDHSPINNINLYSYDVPLTRNNMDPHPIDMQGKKFLQLCKNCNIRILNGRCCGDRLGNLTRFPIAMRESPSTLDYFSANPALMKKVRSLTILHRNGLSDHNCICLSISTKFSVDILPMTVNINKNERVNYASPSEFLRKISSPIAQEKITSFLETYKHQDGVPINTMYSNFMKLFFSCAVKASSSSPRNNKRKKPNNKNKSWYTSECKSLKSIVNRAEKNYRKDPFNKGLLQRLIKARNDFKSKCKEMERKLRNSLSEKLLSISEKNPTEFWNVIKKMQKWGLPKN